MRDILQHRSRSGRRGSTLGRCVCRYPERSEKGESGHAQVQRVSITADSLHGDDQDISECKDCRAGTEIEEEKTASGPESHPLAAACDPPDNGDEGESPSVEYDDAARKGNQTVTVWRYPTPEGIKECHSVQQDAAEGENT